MTERQRAYDASLPSHLAGPLDDWSDADYDAILVRAAETGTPLGGRSVGRLAARLAAVTEERDRLAAIVKVARDYALSWEHAYDCPISMDLEQSCDCGREQLLDALAALNAEKADDAR